MMKLLSKSKLHLSIVKEMISFYFKQKKWFQIPGLLAWSILPLSLTLIVFGVIAVFLWVI